MPIDESHSVMSIPDRNINLWRYMDIPSFISLLVHESLTFVRADLFEDRYEGKLPERSAALIDNQIRKQIAKGQLNKGYWNYSEILNKDYNKVYLNCWCNEQHEMVHMWKIYSKENGIAIETDYDTLKESIVSRETIFPTLVRYVDFKNDVINCLNNGLTVYTLKRKEYKSENEFRLILAYPRILEDQLLKYKSHEEIAPPRKALYLKTPIIKCEVNVVRLIKRIHVSPYAPKWYLDLLKDLSKKYELNVESIIQSEL